MDRITELSGTVPSDENLIRQLRGGDITASAQLFARHFAATQKVAMSYSRDSSSADDLTSDAFECTFKAIRNGTGPVQSIRAYLNTCVRHTAQREALRAARIVSTGEQDVFDRPQPEREGSRPERETIYRAFKTLPERWQNALWLTLVEELTTEETADVMGLTANCVSALTHRARDGLRKAYRDECTHSWVAPEPCKETAAYGTIESPAKKKKTVYLSRGEHITRTASIGQPAKMSLSISPQARRMALVKPMTRA